MIELIPIFQKEAKEFIAKHHRHHKPPVGSIFQIAATLDGKIIAVVMVGRPVARRLQDGVTAEVIRLCTDGERYTRTANGKEYEVNVCSKLYAAAWRAAKAMGYKRMVTYILESETGASLKAAGWKEYGSAGGLSWNVPSRPRVDKHPAQMKIRYEMIA